MDRAEATGLGVAVAGHAALFAALALGFAAAKMPEVRSDPIEVELVTEVGLQSTAPSPSADAPAPRLAEVEGPVEPTAAPPMPEPLPAPPIPQPTPRAVAPPPRPAPLPTPRPVQRIQPARPAPAPPKAAAKAAAAQPKAAPAPAKAQPKAAAVPARAQPRAAPAQPTGRLAGLLNGISDRPSASKATTPPAKSAGPAVEASLVAEVRRQIKPHWQRAVPTGADAEMLRTQVTIALSRSGAVTAMRDVRTTGQTDSNRPQVALHQERAKRAITLAAPFRLPGEYYENWKELTLTLDLRLSQ
jgi:outer membrane biosynthesis protein TonB